jgi:uncharacterized protein YqjF (DUF2071 family)
MTDPWPPTRPSGPNAGTQRWRSLAFLHWPVDAARLRPLVPAQLSLDLHQGVAYVGIVAFAMEAVRPAWLPRALALDFLETNVRTYVRYRGRDPGVYFFSLDAASRLAVRAARFSFGLPYFHARMAMVQTGDQIAYSLQRSSGDRPRLALRYRVDPPRGPAAPGTLEHFLIERYLLYVERRGRLHQARVHHAPYPITDCRVVALEEQLIAASGLPASTSPPPLQHWSPGVDVEVFAPRPTPAADAPPEGAS